MDYLRIHQNETTKYGIKINQRIYNSYKVTMNC